MQSSKSLKGFFLFSRSFSDLCFSATHKSVGFGCTVGGVQGWRFPDCPPLVKGGCGSRPCGWWWVWKRAEGSLLCVYKSIFNPVLEYLEGFLLSGVNLAADLVLSTLNTGELVFRLIFTSSFSA